MDPVHSNKATVSTLVEAPLGLVWTCWNEPEHIKQWYFASEDWHAPAADNDLQVGGRLKIRMEARDGSYGFDFEGTYADVIEQKRIHFVIADGRTVQVTFEPHDDAVRVTEVFELDSSHSPELQQQGWQSILDNFKRYTEALNRNSTHVETH